MASSSPELRMRIAEKVKERRLVRGKTIEELKDTLGMSDVSNTQFGLAIRSLQFRYPEQGVHVCRPSGARTEGISTSTRSPFVLRYNPGRQLAEVAA